MKRFVSIVLFIFFGCMLCVFAQSDSWQGFQSVNTMTGTGSTYSSQGIQPVGATQVYSSTTTSDDVLGGSSSRRAGSRGFSGDVVEEDPELSEQSPIGEPWVLLLMAGVMAVLVYVRKNKVIMKDIFSKVRRSLFVLVAVMGLTMNVNAVNPTHGLFSLHLYYNGYWHDDVALFVPAGIDPGSARVGARKISIETGDLSGTCSVKNLPKSTKVSFRVWNDGIEWRNSTSATQWVNTGETHTLSGNSDSQDMSYFYTTYAGTYTFTINYADPYNPTVKVDFATGTMPDYSSIPLTVGPENSSYGSWINGTYCFYQQTFDNNKTFNVSSSKLDGVANADNRDGVVCTFTNNSPITRGEVLFVSENFTLPSSDVGIHSITATVYPKLQNLTGGAATKTIYYQVYANLTPICNISRSDGHVGGNVTVYAGLNGTPISSSGYYTYQYYNGSSWQDIATTTATSINWTLPSTAGTYYVRVLYTDLGTTFTSESKTITVSDNPIVSINNPPANIRVNNQVTLTATVQNKLDDNGIFTFSESTDGGSSWTEKQSGTSNTYSPILSSAGSYTFKVSYTELGHTAEPRESGTCTVWNNPKVDIANNTAGKIHVGRTVSLTASASYNMSAGTYTFYQSTDDGGTWTEITGYTGTSCTTTPSSTGTYIYKVEFRDSDGATASSPSSAATTVIAEPSVTLGVSPTDMRLGGDVTLTATATSTISAGTYTFYESTNNGSTWNQIKTGAENTCTTQPSAVGTYKYKVVYSEDGFSPEAISSSSVTVWDVANFSSLTPTVSAYNSNYLHGNGTSSDPFVIYASDFSSYGKVNLTLNNISGPRDAVYYKYNGGDGVQMSDQGSSATAEVALKSNSTGTTNQVNFVVYPTNNGHQGESSQTATIYYSVYTDPSVTISCDAGGAVGSTLQLTAYLTGGMRSGNYYTYYYRVAGSEGWTPIATDQSSTYTWPLPELGVYEVKVVYQDKYKPVESDPKTVTVGEEQYRLWWSSTNGSGNGDAYSNAIKNNSEMMSLYMRSTGTLKWQKFIVTDGAWQSWESCPEVQMPAVVTSDGGVYTVTISNLEDVTSAEKVFAPYTGDFYIRSEIAPGKWEDYIDEGNKLTPFTPSEGVNFSYYWISEATAGARVHACVGNNINKDITPQLLSDDVNCHEKQLQSAAAVRYGYNPKTNVLTRSYMATPNTDYLQVEGTNLYSNKEATSSNPTTFRVMGNYTYYAEAFARPSSSPATIWCHSTVNGGNIDRKGTSSTQVQVLSGNASRAYRMRFLYDFKTDRFISAWSPDNQELTDQLMGNAVMTVRHHDNDAEQVIANESGSITVPTVYAVMEFDKEELGENTIYWVSFPFDVKLSDVFGNVGKYDVAWIMQYYDGKSRAEKGGWVENTFWNFVDADATLRACEGYTLCLDPKFLQWQDMDINGEEKEICRLYFPSATGNYTIDGKPKQQTYSSAEYECKIKRPDEDRTVKDSHWHIFGSPVYANISAVSMSEGYTLPGYYKYSKDETGGKYELITIEDDGRNMFKYMHGYISHINGTFTFTPKNTIPSSIAARKANDGKKYGIRLNLLQGEVEQDATYIFLREEAEVIYDRFDLGKILSTGYSQIYTTTDGKMGINSLPIESQMVGLEVKTVKAGEYTFSMPSQSDCIVRLIDHETNIVTDLSQDDYTVSLTKGTISDRFELDITIRTTPTLEEQIFNQYGTNSNEVNKVIYQGQLYILRNGVIYDAMGALIK